MLLCSSQSSRKIDKESLGKNCADRASETKDSLRMESENDSDVSEKINTSTWGTDIHTQKIFFNM